MKIFLYLLLSASCLSVQIHKTNNYNKWNWDKLLNQLTTVVKYYHLEELLPSLDLREVNLTDTCREDLGYLATTITEVVHQIESMIQGNATSLTEAGKHLALPMLDSSSKLGSGILRGHIHFMGFLPQCLNVNYFVKEFDREIRGDYYRVFMNFSSINNTDCSEPYLCPSLDLCLPHSCKNDQLTPLFQSIKTGKWKNHVTKAEHINANIPPADIGTYIVLSLIFVLFGFCILSSIVDYFWLSKSNKRKTDVYMRFVIAFSFHRNVRDIFKIRKTKEDHIQVLHCMRFFSIAWVIAAHSYGYMSLIVKNPIDQLDSVRYGFWTAIYANGFPAVDSFFFMSGLLLGFLWFKEFKDDCIKTMSLKSWGQFYLHRFFRLSPAYYITLLFYTFVCTRLYINMPTLLLSEVQNDTCRDQWWINMLYLNNFVKQQKMCFVVSWYLAVDIQLFIFSPLLLIPFAFSGFMGGLTAALAMLSASIGLSVYQTYSWKFPPILYRLNEANERISSDYQFWMYYQPYIRCQPYIIGVVVGYILQFRKRLRIHHVLNCLFYISSLVVMFLVVFGLHGFLNGRPMSVAESAIYNSLGKLGWSLALAWITISCYYNQGGALQSFMSWWVWIPLGRLSFCAYLIHIPLVLYVWGLDKSERLYAGELDTFVNHILPAIMYSFGVAVFWKALVELPFTKLESLVIKRHKDECNISISTETHYDDERKEYPIENASKIVSIINKDITQL